jgi:hypothetical protein
MAWKTRIVLCFGGPCGTQLDAAQGHLDAQYHHEQSEGTGKQ